MRKLFLLIFILSAAAVFPQNIKVTDYQVPISRAKSLRFNGTWNWSQTGTNVTSNNANANLLFKSFYSSLPLAWFLNVNATGGKVYSDYTHNINIDASFRKYIWNKRDWFGFSQITAEHATNYKQVASDLTVGFGYGRYINATALAKAVRIEEHLLQDDVLNTYLPKEIMIKIANIIERESEYKDIYGDTYETYWFDAIENEIKKSDALNGDKVGSLGILRMRQVLFGINERVNDRYYGWDVTLGILFPLSTFDKSTPGNPNLTLSGRYSVPINWQTQINTIAEAFTPIDSLFFKEARTRIGLDFIYELSSRINFVSGYRLGLFKPSTGKAVVEHNLNASFWYYLENNIYLTITGDFTKQGDNPKIIKTNVGLQYNLF